MFVVIYLSSYFVKTYYLFMKLFVFYNEVRVKEAYLEAPRILQVAGRYQLVLQLNQVQRWSTSENPVHRLKSSLDHSFGFGDSSIHIQKGHGNPTSGLRFRLARSLRRW